MESKDKQEFISKYMTRNMKKWRHVSYSMFWLNRYAETELKAERAWNKLINSQNK